MDMRNTFFAQSQWHTSFNTPYLVLGDFARRVQLFASDIKARVHLPTSYAAIRLACL